MNQYSSGLVLVNKPVGVSSNYVVNGVKRALSVKKAGHTGTLDKMASGMLPVCIGSATKFSSFLVSAKKSYRAKLLFGYQSSTGDMEGSCISHSDRFVSFAELQSVIKDFHGLIMQIPPMYSAIKFKGQPLYKYARNEQDVVRIPRQVEIFSIDIIDFFWPWLTIQISSSKGTYIRTLVEDIAEALGSKAYLVALHRTGVADFYPDVMQDFSLIKSGAKVSVLPTESMLLGMNRVNLSSVLAARFQFGQRLALAHDDGLVAVFSDTGFLGVGEIINGVLKPKRVISCN